MRTQKITIGSRGSDLALWQARHVKSQLENLGALVEIKIIKTQGDVIQHLSFDKMEGKGFFTKEIETALLSKTIDLAIHSHKDLETNPPEGLTIAAVSPRESPADILLVRKTAAAPNELWNLPKNAVVGTSSARRKSQVMRFRPDIEIKDLRGNVPTRINKLQKGLYDAILLANAGVRRLELDLSEFIVIELNPHEFVPAPAQGVLAMQVRTEDKSILEFVAQLNDAQVQKQIAVERAVLNKMDGGCQLPLGVYCPNDKWVYVSYTTDWKSGSSLIKYEVENSDSIVATIVEDLKKI